MAHHGDNPQVFSIDLLRKMANVERQVDEQIMNLGATGKYPQGHLNPNDEGEIRFAIGEENGKIIMNFGKPIAWIGFTPEQAKEIVQSLLTWRAKILNV